MKRASSACLQRRRSSISSSCSGAQSIGKASTFVGSISRCSYVLLITFRRMSAARWFDYAPAFAKATVGKHHDTLFLPLPPMNEQERRALATQEDIDPVTLLHEEREVQFLAGIAEDPVLALHLAFKGGTALRLVYLCDRYSDDLDFDLVRQTATPRTILDRLTRIAQEQNLEITDSWIKRRTVLLETRSKGWKRKLKIEVSLLKRSARVPTIVRNVVTPVFPASVNVLTYPLPVMLAGKILAVLERPYRTPRDLYDLFWLLSRGVQEDALYLKEAATTEASKALVRKKPVLYRGLLKKVAEFPDAQIATELGALLPKTQRQWATAALKDRTRELLTLRIAGI